MMFAACFVIGLALGWFGNEYLRNKRQRLLSQWEPGMIITTTDGERLYVCAVESWEPSGEQEKKT